MKTVTLTAHFDGDHIQLEKIVMPDGKEIRVYGR